MGYSLHGGQHRVVGGVAGLAEPLQLGFAMPLNAFSVVGPGSVALGRRGKAGEGGPGGELLSWLWGGSPPLAVGGASCKGRPLTAGTWPRRWPTNGGSRRC